MAIPLGAAETHEPAVLSSGEIRCNAAGGVTILDRVAEFGHELSFGVGLTQRVAYAAPLALGIRLIDARDRVTVYVGGGIVDWFITRDAVFLYSPSATLASQVRIGPSYVFRAALDITGAEEGLQRGGHGAWFRGAAAVLLDLGEFASLTIGIGYQRRIVGKTPVAESIDRLGWIGDARVSIGSVHSQPFTELPTISIHMQPYMDLIAITRFDFNTSDNTTDSRFLVGIQLKR